MSAHLFFLLVWLVIVFFGVYAFLKFIWEPNNTEHLKQLTYIRELEWRKKQIEAGINPDGMPFGYDHSCDLHNYNCTCEHCKTVSAKNDKLIRKEAAIRKKLLES